MIEFVRTVRHERIHKMEDGKLKCKKNPTKSEIEKLDTIEDVSKWDLCKLCFSRQERHDHPKE